MLYMVVERYVAGAGPVYARAAAHGRMLPKGLRYLDSWIVDEDKLERCFQLGSAPKPADEATARWPRANVATQHRQAG